MFGGPSGRAVCWFCGRIKKVFVFLGVLAWNIPGGVPSWGCVVVAIATVILQIGVIFLSVTFYLFSYVCQGNVTLRDVRAILAASSGGRVLIIIARKRRVSTIEAEPPTSPETPISIGKTFANEKRRALSAHTRVHNVGVTGVSHRIVQVSLGLQ